jgi:hypothetical protein
VGHLAKKKSGQNRTAELLKVLQGASKREQHRREAGKKNKQTKSVSDSFGSGKS